MMTGLIQDQNLEKQIEKQIGCMSGFLHIFDRQQILAGKRVYSTKRLTSSPESVKSVQSTASSREIENPKPKPVTVEPPSTPPRSPLPPSTPPRSPLPLPIFEMKDGSYKNSWKFCKEMPRLSLDSRATVDSKGSLCAKESLSNKSFDKQQRSPSVIARLMGLGELPSSQQASEEESIKKPELRRSASESRVSRELFNSRFIDGNNVSHTKPFSESNKIIESNNNSSLRTQKNEGVVKTSQWRLPQQRRSFFDSGDVFPETKQTSVAVYDTEKSLKLRGIDEQTKDLETLKHILEALQFKGLLHSNRPVTRDSQRNFVYDDSNSVHTKPWRSGAPNRRFGEFGGVNRYSGEISPSVSPRKDRGVVFDRSGRSPVRGRNSPDRSGNSIVKRKPLSIETERRMYESSDSRRNSPINSPKLTPKRSGSDMYSGTNRSPRSNRLTESGYSKQKITRNILLEDESSSISESSGSTTSHSDLERSKTEENREGKSLLARCDKLLHSIAEMNSINESHTSFNSVIPSPVSVLDSAFDKDESSSPSPVMKRTIDFKDVTVDTEDDIWRSIISSVNSTEDNQFEFQVGLISDDYDFKYISRILRVSKHFSDNTSAFYFLEKQYYRNESGAKLKRKLVFDVVNEIINEQRELPPWKTTESNWFDSAKRICSEFEKIRETEPADNLLDLICNVLKKDLAGSNGWVDQPVEVSEAVLYIERLIFKDLVSETIRDLADFAGKTMLFAPRRKLVF